MKNLTKKQKMIILSVVAAVVVVVTAVCLYRHFHPTGEVTSQAYEFEEGQEKDDTSGVAEGIAIPGYSEIRIPAGTTTAEVTLTNPSQNQVYFEISFYLPETDEVIYTSKLIEPGKSLYEIELNQPLEEGEYDLTIQYATYAMDEDFTPMNGAEVNCKLIVEAE